MSEEEYHSVGFRVTREMKEALIEKASEKHMKVSDLVREYIRKGLGKENLK